MIERIGKMVSWLSLVLVILIVLDVAMRYLFSTSKNWVIEMEWHIFSLLFLLGSAFAFRHDKHVRVDVFYQKFSAKTQNIIDLLGHIFFLIPWTILVLVTGYKFALNSWYIREGSSQPGGLPARYFIKGMIVIGFFLILIQGLIFIIDSVKKLRK